MNDYRTPLDPISQHFYDAWLQSQTAARGFDPSGPDYDMPGYYMSGGWLDAPGSGHFPDSFKAPNHPTFSDESMYHMTPNGAGGLNLGGAWNDDTFQAGPTNRENWAVDELLKYFLREEPGVGLRY